MCYRKVNLCFRAKKYTPVNPKGYKSYGPLIMMKEDAALIVYKIRGGGGGGGGEGGGGL